MKVNSYLANKYLLAGDDTRNCQKTYDIMFENINEKLINFFIFLHFKKMYV